MKQILSYVLPGLALWLLVFSCTKDPVRPGSASLTLVNVLVGADTLVTSFKESGDDNVPAPLQWYGSALQILYGEYVRVSSYTGTTSLSLSHLSDTLKSLYSTRLNLPVGSMHTLFLTGNQAQVDTLLTTDVIPYYPGNDTVTGVRFVHLSPDSAPIKVTIKGGIGEPLVSNLAYKGVTAFQDLPVKSSARIDTLEVWDALSGKVLVTYPLQFRLFNSQTVVFYGNAEQGLAMMQVSHY